MVIQAPPSGIRRSGPFITNNFCALNIMWRDHEAIETHESFDFSLRCQTGFGHRGISHTLLRTSVQSLHPNTLLVAAHEARFAVDQVNPSFAIVQATKTLRNSVPRANLSYFILGAPESRRRSVVNEPHARAPGRHDRHQSYCTVRYDHLLYDRAAKQLSQKGRGRHVPSILVFP